MIDTQIEKLQGQGRQAHSIKFNGRAIPLETPEQEESVN